MTMSGITAVPVLVRADASGIPRASDALEASDDDACASQCTSCYSTLSGPYIPH